MDRMTSLRVFREVVEAGSFVAAAERLGLSPPMASKHVAQLEKSLGARLLHRSSRHLSLTEAGTAWYEQSRRALDLLDAAEAAIGQAHDAPRGQLKVSAPVWCATPRFARVLADYREKYPEAKGHGNLPSGKSYPAPPSKRHADPAQRSTSTGCARLCTTPASPYRCLRSRYRLGISSVISSSDRRGKNSLPPLLLGLRAQDPIRGLAFLSRLATPGRVTDVCAFATAFSSRSPRKSMKVLSLGDMYCRLV
jgi:molybdenum-dependent DNA-binding transcriptional regulator ModE